MPLLEAPSYEPAPLFRHAHAATSLPTLLRRVGLQRPQRLRIATPDADFLDLDCWWQGAERRAATAEGRPTVVLCHGLEGSADRQYMRGMARAFLRRGWNAVGVNYRGCSGEPNRLPRSYHSGATDDLRAVLQQVHRADRPVRALVGFSLGGNLVLKYLGEDPGGVLPGLQAAVAVSVPADLDSSERQLRRPGNRLYLRRFLRKLAAKIRAKAALFPAEVDARPLAGVRWLRDFDDLYTAPLHGFADAAEYYARCSCRPFLPAVQVPTLMLSAADDPFLGEACYPREEAVASAVLHLQVTAHGGHVGFRAPGGEYWSETRACTFVTAHSSQV